MIDKLLLMAPAAISAFMNPERMMALVNAVSATFDYVKALNNENPADDYAEAVDFAQSQYKLLDSVCGFSDEIDNYMLNTAIPELMKWFYPDGK